MLIDARAHWKGAVGTLIAVAVSVAIAFVLSSQGVKKYTAESRLVVTAGLGLSGTSVDLTMAPTVGQTYAELATTRPILQEVIDRTQVPYDTQDLTSRIKVMADPIVPFLTITMTDEVPDRAALVANALADILVQRATIPVAADGSNPPGERNLLAEVEQATAPQTPSSPRVLYDSAMAGAATLVVMLVLLAGLAYLRADRRPGQELPK